MACNNTGPFTTEFAAKWGIADFDWSNWIYGENQTWDGKQYGGYSEQVPETCQQNLRVQAAMTKAANNDTKVFVYRNMVKALPWYKAVREKLVDPDYSGFFLPFKCNASASDPKVLPREGGCHVPRQGTPLYHDQEQTIHGKTCPTNGSGSQACCGVPCGEYVFDHRNGSMLRQWFIDEFIGGEDGIDSPFIDGFFFDDNWGRTGASEMDLHNIEDTGLTPTEQKNMQDAWRVNTAAVGEAVLAKGGFAVPYFIGMPRNESDPKSHCAQDMAAICKINATTGRPNVHDQALLLEFTRLSHGQLWYANGTLPYFEQDL